MVYGFFIGTQSWLVNGLWQLRLVIKHGLLENIPDHFRSVQPLNFGDVRYFPMISVDIYIIIYIYIIIHKTPIKPHL